METCSDCTVSPSSGRRDLLGVASLTAGVLVVHGYHPWAEDGGLYIAGVEYRLNPDLFPRETAFVTEHLRFSVFAPAMAWSVRLSHLSLPVILLGVYLLSAALLLDAALRVARRCFQGETACWVSVALLAAWWTLPIAGTSLLLMDPYVTARTLSTPLSLLAVAAALEPWAAVWPKTNETEVRNGSRPALLCAGSLLIAAAFHPLMAGYALGLVLAIRLQRGRASLAVWTTLLSATLGCAALVQAFSQWEAPSVLAAVYSRYYWFLSQWQWFEWLGLLGPLLIIAAVRRWGEDFITAEARVLCRALLITAAFAIAIAGCLAQEHFVSHPIARLQPLRVFLLVYITMILFLGGLLGNATEKLRSKLATAGMRGLAVAAPIAFVGAMAGLMLFVQRSSFSSSLHLELPGRVNPNSWVKAFVWSRDHTPPSALFALDARYVNTEGEDAQTFRAIALRSAIPDFSKDGGEASISPSLAPEWYRSATATAHLSELSDADRDALLRPFGVQWVVLHANARTTHACPYRNQVVKVCRIG